MRTKTIFTMLVLASIFCQSISIYSQGTVVPIDIPNDPDIDKAGIFAGISKQSRPADLAVLLEGLFGNDAAAAARALSGDNSDLLRAVTDATDQRAKELLDDEISKRRERKASEPAITPETKGRPTKRTSSRPGRRGFVGVSSRFDWRQFAFGFQPLPAQDEKPEVKMTESDKEIKAEGTDKKAFETKDAKGTRTQKAETRYIKDGKTFGVEIKQATVIEAVSKPEGKTFRQELSIEWGAEVAACPDINGVTAGTGKAKVTSKTTYIDNGVTTTVTSDFDLQAKLTGHVNDQAEMTHYDLTLDAYTTNSGFANALQRNLIKEIKLKDGRYGLHFEITGNTIEVSDGTYGGKRTPAKLGKVSATKLVPMDEADTKTVGAAIGPMVPSIWNSANDMYKTAEKSWKNYGCVEVMCTVPRTTLKPGAEVVISTETVHLHDSSKVNAQLKAESYHSDITPEEQAARPSAKFTLTQTGDEGALFSVESVSKRGIGKGDIDFKLEKEEQETAGVWSGTIKAERETHEEREKRSGANLAENGGSMETTTTVQLQLTGMLDRTVDATNAYIANITGRQQMVDLEYDRYKIDEGYCGPGAVPYKGPKEITRTSTTTATYNKQTRVYLEIGGTEGSITFSLPDINGTTVHRYVHKSPCADHDRANTNETTDDEAATVGGSFAFSFPIDPTQKIIRGTVTVRGEDGSTTTYSWELSQRPN